MLKVFTRQACSDNATTLERTTPSEIWGEEWLRSKKGRGREQHQKRISPLGEKFLPKFVNKNIKKKQAKRRRETETREKGHDKCREAARRGVGAGREWAGALPKRAKHFAGVFVPLLYFRIFTLFPILLLC